MLAQAYEFGDFGAFELEEARNLYAWINKYASYGNEEALLGEARSLIRLDVDRYRNKIESRCHQAIDRYDAAQARMILGALKDQVDDGLDAAQAFYLGAYRKGLPWGLRFLSIALRRRGHHARAFLLLIVTVLTSPFLVARYGARGPYSHRLWIHNLVTMSSK